MLLVAVMLAAAAGCSGLGSSDVTAVGVVPVSVEASALGDPGAEIVSGVSVPKGTQLIDRAAPTLQYDFAAGTATRVGWGALFLVTGDPVQVWSDMARELGVGEEGGPENSCWVSRETTDAQPTESRPLADPKVEGENALRCSFTSTSVWMTMRVGADLRCTGSNGGPGPCELIPVAHLWVSSTDVAPDETGKTPKPTEPVSRGDFAMPGFPADLTPRPLLDQGKAIDDGLDYHLWGGSYRESDTTFTIPDCGRSLVAPADLNECTGSATGMLFVDAPPEEAVRAIAEQGEGQNKVATGRWDGHGWAYSQLDQAGGYHVTVTGIDREGGGSTVWFSDCGD